MYTFTFFNFIYLFCCVFSIDTFHTRCWRIKFARFFARRRIDLLLISMNLTLCPTFLLSISIWIFPIFFTLFLFCFRCAIFVFYFIWNTPISTRLFFLFQTPKMARNNEKKMFVLQRKKFSPCNWKCFLPVFPINFFSVWNVCVCFCASSNFSIGI